MKTQMVLTTITAILLSQIALASSIHCAMGRSADGSNYGSVAGDVKEIKIEKGVNVTFADGNDMAQVQVNDDGESYSLILMKRDGIRFEMRAFSLASPLAPAALINAVDRVSISCSKAQ